MTQATTGGRNGSWRRIATGGLQVTVFSPDIFPSTAAENEWIWSQQQKKNWPDIPGIDFTLICDHSASHNGVDKYSDLQGFYTSPTSKYSGTVVKVPCYKSEGLWFDPSWRHWKFSLTSNPSDRTVALGSTQPLTEMSTRSTSWGWRRPVRKADNLTTILCRCHEIWEC